MPRHPQPVPPIFQPEVAARAVVAASENPRREFWVGWPTIKTIVGNKIVPGLADRYLARTGYDSQQMDEPITPDRDDNLLAPADEQRDFGPHGIFDHLARPSSAMLPLTLHRRFFWGRRSRRAPPRGSSRAEPDVAVRFVVGGGGSPPPPTRSYHRENQRM